MKNSNKKPFKLFDFQKEGRGISKNENLPVGSIKRGFRLYFDNFSKFVSINMLMVLGNFPFLFAIFAYSGVTQAQVYNPTSDVFGGFQGAFSGQSSAAFSSFYSVEGMPASTLSPTGLTTAFYIIGLLTIFTFGLVNVGCAYIFRNLLSGEPVFIWTDFWHGVKKNYKQGLLFGIVDILIMFILGANVVSLSSSGSNFLMTALFYGNLILLLIYFAARFYIYLQIVTFDLSFKKILKNAFIFSLLGFKRNFVGTFFIAVLTCLEIAFAVSLGGFLVPLAVAFPLLIFFSTCAYIKVFAAYEKIHTYMILPYLEEHPKEPAPAPIMRDDVQ